MLPDRANQGGAAQAQTGPEGFRDAPAVPSSNVAAPLIVVAGGVVGAGSSTVAGLMAHCAADMCRTTLLIEADGPQPQASRVVRAAENLYVVRARTHGLRPAGPLANRFSLIIIDAGWRVDSVLEACAAGADRVLVVVTPGHAPISAGYALVKAVERRFPGTRFEVVVNRRRPDGTAALFEYLQTASLTFLHRAIALAALLPDDACLHAGTRGGMPLFDAAAGSAVADAINALTCSKLAEFDRARGAASSLFMTEGALP